MRDRRTPIRVIAAACAACLAVLSGCSIPDQSRPDVLNIPPPVARPSAVSQPDTPDSARVELYFVNGANRLVAVTRSKPFGGVAAAVDALLAGPTAEESASGLDSSIPVGTKLNWDRRSGSTESLDFSADLASLTGREQLLAFAQIVVTTDSVPGVDRVQFSIAGQAVNCPEPDGTLAQGPVSRATYAGLIHP